MFDNLKKIQQLKEIKNSLEGERIEVEKEGIKVIVNGKMEVEEIKLNSSLNLEDQERIIRDCINESVKKIQMIVAQKMMQMQ
jgi:DNA-binding protein YbaB